MTRLPLLLLVALLACLPGRLPAQTTPRPTADNAAAPRTAGQPAIERVVLFHIDALFPDADTRLDLPHIRALKQAGTTVQEAVVVFPYHPTVGDYGKLHTTSLPNPVTMTGTVFLTPEQVMLQTPFFRAGKTTAHIANSTAYASLNRDYHYVVMDRSNRDADNVAAALDLLARKDVAFLRLLLQDLNNRGSQAAGIRDTAAAYYGNVWHPASPYRRYARTADSLLGHFVAGLKRMGKWETTLLVLVSDGTANWGWHPPMSEESWRIPLVFVGPGIAQSRVLPYAENTDIAPSILALAGMPFANANGGHGTVIRGLRSSEAVPPPPRDKPLLRLNRQLKAYWLLTAELRLLAAQQPAADIALMQATNGFLTEAQFYTLERLSQWPEAGTLAALLAQNDAALAYLRQALATARAAAARTGAGR